MISRNGGTGVVGRYLVEHTIVLQDVGVGCGSRSVVHAYHRALDRVAIGAGRQISSGVGFHLDVRATEQWRAVGSDVIRCVCRELIFRFLEMDFVFVAAREGVGLEALSRQVVRQTQRGFLRAIEVALVGNGGGGEVEPDGQRLFVGEAEVVARPAFLCRVVIHVVRLALVGCVVEVGHFTQLLCPVALVGAVVLQLLCHLAALELLLGHLRALWLAAGVEVIAVGEGGVVGEGIVIGGGVVRAGVEAAGQRAGAVLTIYKSAHAFLTFLHGGVDRALDEAVGDGDLGVGVYIGNQASSPASVAGIAARDVHRADAARDGGVAIGALNQS